MDKNVLLTIEYDGTQFSGWQRQPGKITVQGRLEEALSQICGQEITIDGTSRTDAGVHALGQRATFHGDFGIPVANLKRAVNDMLAKEESYRGKPGPIRIVEAKEVEEGFHARYNSCGKMYRYIIDNSKEVSLQDRNFSYHLKDKLDLEAMVAATKYIIGDHDFKAFQAAGGNPTKTTEREIYSLTVKPQGERVEIQVIGDGFLYNMVRIIVGTLVKVGLGKATPEDVKAIIDSRDRQKAGFTAPAEGLYLVKVYYSQEGMKEDASLEDL